MPELSHTELVARWAAVRAEVLHRNLGYLSRDSRGIPKGDAWLGIYTFLLHQRQPLTKAAGGAQ
jgi:hypothetical protein